ncbi:MAG: hypothetical protein Q7J82_03135 [Coriobacteriia bacterium]|nr:hypothetical protein [Coriobacteriia bacterium]
MGGPLFGSVLCHVGKSGLVSAILVGTDDVRLHTVPGDTVRFVFDDLQSTMFMVESRGWYRSLER